MMKNYFYDNYESLINLKPKKIHFILLLSIFFGGILIWGNNIETYDILNTKGYVYCSEKCNIKITLSINDANKLNNINYISINNKYIDIFNYSLSDIMFDEDFKINYKILTIISDDNIDNEIIHEIKIYYNKKNLLKKIITMLFS